MHSCSEISQAATVVQLARSVGCESLGFRFDFQT